MGDAASQGRILVAAGLDYDYAEQSYILNVTATVRLMNIKMSCIFK